MTPRDLSHASFGNREYSALSRRDAVRNIGEALPPIYGRTVAIAPFHDQGRASSPHPSRLTRILNRLSDGEHLWGTVDVSPANRSVWSRTHLTVYAPGTSRSERRLLRIVHAWPLIGAVLGLLLMIAFHVLPAPEAFAIGLALYAAGFWPLMRVTRRLRAGSRHLVVAVVDIGDRYELTGDLELMRACLQVLREMDRALTLGAITPVEFEACWSDIYRLLPPTPTRRRRVDRTLANDEDDTDAA